MGRPAHLLYGQRFGRLVVLHRVEDNARKHPQWLCICDCGVETVKASGGLIRGRVRSCGCLTQDGPPNKTHGMTGTPVYHVWWAMKKRCAFDGHPDYADYGGRGITVCPEWRSSFAAFYADMGPRPGDGYSLDRIDCDGNYEPSNCRWATIDVQARNKRSNRWFTVDGQKTCLEDCAALAGVQSSVLIYHLNGNQEFDMEAYISKKQKKATA